MFICAVQFSGGNAAVAVISPLFEAWLRAAGPVSDSARRYAHCVGRPKDTIAYDRGVSGWLEYRRVFVEAKIDRSRPAWTMVWGETVKEAVTTFCEVMLLVKMKAECVRER